jgi:Arc/MetJ family transcription regulator
VASLEEWRAVIERNLERLRGSVTGTFVTFASPRGEHPSSQERVPGTSILSRTGYIIVHELDIQNGGEGMAKTSVDIDLEKLDKVRGILGTESIRETISAAFREVIRMAAVRDLVALGESGAFDFLLEPGAEEQMWG